MRLAVAVAALAAGTFAFRWAGPVLRSRLRFPDHAARILEIGAVVLLAALAAVTTLPIGGDRIGIALPCGVIVAGLLVWRRAPLPVVIVVAAAATATVRLLGGS